MTTYRTRTALLASAMALAILPGAVAPGRAMAADAVVQGDGPGSGTLLLRAPGVATAMPAVRLGTDMNVTVTGSIARVRVTQAFRNTGTRWMEASYLYPLPENGAVDTLKMVVGQHVILGTIKRRADAKQSYETAKAAGQKAGLVEQQRPDMFTTNVANIGPGETVLVSIEYQAPVRQTAGTFSLRLPLVVGPRYVPPHTLVSTGAIADAAAVTAAPLLGPKLGAINPVSITVHLAPGFAPANVVSPYHRVSIAASGEQRTVTLAAGEVPADRDFELDWRSAAADPTLAVFRQHVGASDYVMASIVPPADTGRLPVPPREMVFVIDNSGSMGGASMDEAKASLVHALGTLRPQDRFNIIRFDDTMTQLFDHSVAATPDQVMTAMHFAQGLQANGGTEMLPALKAALADAAATGDVATVRQIVFLTDGDVSNEDEMAAAISQDRGGSHVFLVGIGSAPNDYLMTRMATIGRGTYTHIGTAQEVAAKTTALLDILRHPAMQEVTARVTGGTLDLTPKVLPDLYAGEPLVLLGRTDRLAGTLTVGGRIGDRRWSQSIDLASAIESPAVARLWARHRIDDIETERTLGHMEGDAADAAVATLGLEHSLVTSQTSLVAIDATPSRPAGATLTREELPIDLPAGWDFATLFGSAAARASAAHVPAAYAQDAAEAMELPQTATGFAGVLGEGLAMLIAGAAGLAWLRRHDGRAA